MDRYTDATFEGIHHLYILLLSRCGLLKVPNIKPLAETLNYLSLNRNFLTHIEDGLFEGFNNLVRLSLNKNKLIAVPDISDIPALGILDLMYNEIASTDNFPKEPHSNIKRFMLMKNAITEFDLKKIIEYFPALELLSLRGNRIQSLEDPLFGTINSTKLQMYLARNQWFSCNFSTPPT